MSTTDERQERRGYALTPEDVATIQRALRERRDDIRADQDYADDERAEHVERVERALAALVLDYPRWKAPESIEWRIMVRTDGHGGTEVHSEYDDEDQARIELAMYADDYPHHRPQLQRREVGAWETLQPEIRPIGNEGRPE